MTPHLLSEQSLSWQWRRGCVTGPRFHIQVRLLSLCQGSSALWRGHGPEVDAPGHRRICGLLQTAELHHQIAAGAGAGAAESLEVEQHLHVVSSQLADRSMGCSLVSGAQRSELRLWRLGSFWLFFFSSCSFYRHPQMVQDLISSHSLLSHSLVAVSTGDPNAETLQKF